MLGEQYRVYYITCMSEQSEILRQRRKSTSESASGRFITLKDGRKIYEPARGGKYSKAEIRAAVKQAREVRLRAEAG